MQTGTLLTYFIEKCKSAKTLAEIEELVCIYLDDLGFAQFAFEMKRGTREANRTLTLLSNYPEEWVRHYIDRKYWKDDLVHIRAHRTLVPFSWADAQRGGFSERAATLFDEARQVGITDGVTVPVRGLDNTFGVFSVIAAGIKPERDEAIRRHTATLSVLAATVHEQVWKLVREQQALSGEREVLTPRELEILKWLASGKTSQDIAAILGIGDATVNTHTAAICRKLNATSRTHAAVIGTLQGLIEPE